MVTDYLPLVREANNQVFLPPKEDRKDVSIAERSPNKMINRKSPAWKNGHLIAVVTSVTTESNRI